MHYTTEILLRECADSRLSPGTTHLADVIYEWKLAGLPDETGVISTACGIALEYIKPRTLTSEEWVGGG
tara:strand:- start:208 stop:414 length:207 start_codon:yes stop_codon:yes gene_type:complete